LRKKKKKPLPKIGDFYLPTVGKVEKEEVSPFQKSEIFTFPQWGRLRKKK
jgi:hypothetical protein